jgi:hypothetical protein
MKGSHLNPSMMSGNWEQEIGSLCMVVDTSQTYL